MTHGNPPRQCLWWPDTSSDPTKKPKGSYLSKWFQNVSDVSSFINRQQWEQQLCSMRERVPMFWSFCIILSVWADWRVLSFIIIQKIPVFKVCEWLRFAARTKFDWDKLADMNLSPSSVVLHCLGQQTTWYLGQKTNDSNAVIPKIVTVILILILKL